MWQLADQRGTVALSSFLFHRNTSLNTASTGISFLLSRQYLSCKYSCILSLCTCLFLFLGLLLLSVSGSVLHVFSFRSHPRTFRHLTFVSTLLIKMIHSHSRSSIVVVWPCELRAQCAPTRNHQRQQRRHRFPHWYVIPFIMFILLQVSDKAPDHAIGYLAIHLLGLSTGTFLLPPSPSYFRRRQQAYTKSLSQTKNTSVSSSGATSGMEKADYLTHGPDGPASSWEAVGQVVGDEAGETYRENDRTATELASYAFIWWTLLGACSLLGVGGGVSRRMVYSRFIQLHQSFLLPCFVSLCGFLTLLSSLSDRRTSPTSHGSQRTTPPSSLDISSSTSTSSHPRCSNRYIRQRQN